MGKSKEISQDIRNSRCLKVPRSSVQTIIRKYKQHGSVQPSYRSGRRWLLSPGDERVLVRNVRINSTAKDLVKMLAEAVLYRHALKDRLHFAHTHRDKDPNFWRHVLCQCFGLGITKP
uniref:Transposase n=1 Tax=Denticeps clupeoides TaxID=299321 RepID=A0AAY4EKC2_9TELE